MTSNGDTSSPSDPAHIWFLLDRSGSMNVLAQDVIFGLQEFVAEQKLADPNARLTLVQFDSEDPHEVVLDSKRLVEVDALRAVRRFEPRGATPLYDAIAALINRADHYLKRKGGDDADQLVVIFTDGLENASTDTTRAKAFKLLKERRDRGWTFAFLGANQDAFVAGEAIGVAPKNRRQWEATRAGAHVAFSDLKDRSALHLRRSRAERLEKREDFYEDDGNEDE